MQNWIILFMLFLTAACSNGSSDRNLKGDFQFVEKKVKDDTVQTQQSPKVFPPINDSLLSYHNLVDVQSLNNKIYVELKYAGSDNFLKIQLYDRIRKAYLQKDVAERLSRCQELLTSIDTSLHLLIYDAVRPVSVQKKMWNALDSIPTRERGKYVSSPTNKSLHNYGAAVDITICDTKGHALDMGAAFDEFNEIAFPTMEAHFLATGDLTKAQVENRKLLRKVMRSQYFRNLPTEWWHFNACSRADAALKYTVLENEP